MTFSLSHLEHVELHWAVQAIPEAKRKFAFAKADRLLVERNLGNILHFLQEDSDTTATLEEVAMAYELAAIEGLNSHLYPSQEANNTQLQETAQAGSYRAFGILRVLPIPLDTDQRLLHVLHLAGLAYVGERWTDLRRWFSDQKHAIEIPSVADVDWDKRLLYRVFECWVRLLRKKDWDDLEQISQIILGLRNDQSAFENKFIDKSDGSEGASLALRLVGLYHLAKATECLAVYMLQGNPPSIYSLLDQHFEAASKAAQAGRDTQFEMVLRWLHVASRKMASGSVWWVARAVNSRVTRFVDHATKHRGLFELLPPQRIALQEEGLLDQANRAVIVDMPTSAGKTQLAEFRMLQALNQFGQDDGWVAYVAPTRALVSQITRRLRGDFGPIGIHVEQLTGALDVDAFEDALLGQKQAFQILVATPEKLQLVIRNKKINRPLALVVMDEAHNIEDEERGLRIELLLATIKQEASRANFLLLMPFVPNAKDLANWLAPENGHAISLSTVAWQPNERIVGIFDIQKGEKKGDWELNFETLTTTQRTLSLHGRHKVDGNRPIQNLSYSQASSLSSQAVAMAKVFSKRGTSIAVAQKIPDVWGIARKASIAMEPMDEVSEEIKLVQRFLATEISPDFELIQMLSKGVAVHHAGLPSEALALIEWLTEIGQIRVLCATTTIAQGLNFPVSSVFLATTKYPYGVPMSHRAFWNLAGRAGRIGQDSVGVVGIAAGSSPNDVRKYVSCATGGLVSRLEKMLEDIQRVGELTSLSAHLMTDQWADFRSYIAHLWNEKRNLDVVISEAEQTLRNTFGFGMLRSKSDSASQNKAEALLEVTRSYVRELAQHPENAVLADATGFSPEGVRTALLELNKLENKLGANDWRAESLFGEGNKSALPELMGVMMRLPQLRKGLEEIKGDGVGHRKLADISQAWVSGSSLAEIALEFFDGVDLTEKVSKACKAVCRDLANNAAWGLSAISKLPTAGIDFETLSEAERQSLNSIPAMLYHGVRSQEAVLMRMNSVPRSVAESVGAEFKERSGSSATSEAPKLAAEFVRSLKEADWERLKPRSSVMSGRDYQQIWKRLSGL